MDNIPTNVTRPPVPEGDYDDIPEAGEVQQSGALRHGRALLANPLQGDRYVRHYYGCIETVDQAVGRVMQAVGNSTKEWVVIFASDHGFHLLDKERTSKYTLWPMST